jgi:parallel beta-helix repeat protein
VTKPFVVFALVAALCTGLVDSGPARGAVTTHAPIAIYGDSQFTPERGVVAGTGAVDDPFIIEGWDIDASSETGIYLQGTRAHVVIRDCRVHNGGTAISFFDVAHATVQNNTISDAWSAISATQSVDLAVIGNDILRSKAGVFLFTTRDAILSENRFISGGGVSLFGSSLAEYTSHSIAPNNTIDGHPILFYKDAVGIDVDRVDAAQVLIVNVTSPRVSNLTLSDALRGLFLGFVKNAIVSNNTIRNTLDGLFLDKSTGVEITGNTVETNEYAGITVMYSSTSVLTGNTIEGNAYGLRVELKSSATVFHNNFLGTQVHAVIDIESGALLDGGYPRGGNYWSDYAGWDHCGGPDQTICPDPDGIGDTPRFNDRLFPFKDNYPLMSPFTGSPPSPPEPYVLHGSAAAGWGPTPLSMTAPGPAFTVLASANVSLHLFSEDGLPHDWFLDINNNSLLDEAEPSSGDFLSSTVPLEFTFQVPPGLVGTVLYRCRHHPTTMSGAFFVRPIRAPPDVALSGGGSGWGVMGGALSNPGPELTLYYGEVAWIVLTGADNDNHAWFVDYNGDSVAQIWEPTSSAFRSGYGTFTTFRANVPGTFVYRCVFHPTSATGVLRVIAPWVSDRTPPVTNAAFSGVQGRQGWFTSAVRVNLSAHDADSTVRSTSYRLDGGAWQRYSGPFDVSEDGDHSLEFYSVDGMLNQEITRTNPVRIDAAPPEVHITSPGSNVSSGSLTAAWTGSDNTSGLAGYLVQVDGGSVQATGLGASLTLSLAPGPHTLLVTATDVAGNAASASLTFTVASPPGEAPTDGRGADIMPLIGVAAAGMAGTAALALWLFRRRPGRRMQ